MITHQPCTVGITIPFTLNSLIRFFTGYPVKVIDYLLDSIYKDSTVILQFPSFLASIRIMQSNLNSGPYGFLFINKQSNKIQTWLTRGKVNIDQYYWSNNCQRNVNLQSHHTVGKGYFSHKLIEIGIKHK